MHERAPISKEAIRLLDELPDRSPPPSVVTVAIATDVDVDTARDAWEAATTATRLEGVPVEWVVRSAVLVCLTCAREYEGDKLSRCPVCGGDGLITEAPPTAQIVSWGSSTT